MVLKNHPAAISKYPRYTLYTAYRPSLVWASANYLPTEHLMFYLIKEKVIVAYRQKVGTK